MKDTEKISYKECNKLFKGPHNEVLLFNETFFHRIYEVKLKRKKEDVISVLLNNEEVIYVTDDEFGIMFSNDPTNLHTAYKVNLANLFTPNGYRLSFFENDILLNRYSDGYSFPVHTFAIIKKDGHVETE